jgi:hypothetical protein
MLGGGPYTYYTGSYSFKDGIFKGELVLLNQHNSPPPSHVFFNAKNVGIGVSGTYAGDQAELTGIALVGKRSLTLHVTGAIWANSGSETFHSITSSED